MSGETEHAEDMKGLDGVGTLSLNLLSRQRKGEGLLQKGEMIEGRGNKGRSLSEENKVVHEI